MVETLVETGGDTHNPTSGASRGCNHGQALHLALKSTIVGIQTAGSKALDLALTLLKIV